MSRTSQEYYETDDELDNDPGYQEWAETIALQDQQQQDDEQEAHNGDSKAI